MVCRGHAEGRRSCPCRDPSPGGIAGPAAGRVALSLWLPVIFVLGAPVLPESRWSLEGRFGPKQVVIESPIRAASPKLAADGPELPEPVSGRSAPNWIAVAGSTWLAGAVLTLAFGLVAYARATRRIRWASHPVSPETATELKEAALVCGLRRVPNVFVSREIQSPAVTGFLRPALLLPFAFESTFTRGERHVIFLHELIHIKRADLPLNWLLVFLQALHWCNPLIWLAFARLRADREAACDSGVLAASEQDSRRDYGHALLKLESGPGQSAWSVCFVGIFERGAVLRHRIKSIAAYRRSHPAWGIPGTCSILVLAMLGATRAQSEHEVSPQVQIASSFVEVSGDALVNILGARGQAKGGGVYVQDAAQAEVFAEDLRQTPGADILSSPSVVTTSGHLASVWIGEKGKGGINLEILPVVSGQSIELTLKAEVAASKIETKVSMSRGDALILLPAQPDGSAKPGRRLVIVVKPRLLLETEMKLHSMVLSKVEFREASLSEAVAFLQAKTRELDPGERRQRARALAPRGS